ncbi:hypothetical protein PGT21_029449 [Puccinia graminis f. sp. tritici]|nr:hypothetical protein PGT21_029449 [Puccinia graminis f. sp. tritici]
MVQVLLQKLGSEVNWLLCVFPPQEKPAAWYTPGSQVPGHTYIFQPGPVPSSNMPTYALGQKPSTRQPKMFRISML